MSESEHTATAQTVYDAYGEDPDDLETLAQFGDLRL